MKVIINRFIPFGKKFYAINLCGILFAKGPCDKLTINHEKIHTRQITELLVVGFYLWYLLEWLVKLIQHRNYFTAYKNISFEREAYANGNDLTYLPRRRRFAFMHYI